MLSCLQGAPRCFSKAMGMQNSLLSTATPWRANDRSGCRFQDCVLYGRLWLPHESSSARFVLLPRNGDDQNRSLPPSYLTEWIMYSRQRRATCCPPTECFSPVILPRRSDVLIGSLPLSDVKGTLTPYPDNCLGDTLELLHFHFHFSNQQYFSIALLTQEISASTFAALFTLAWEH